MASSAESHFSPAMLPLVSSTMPRLTGTRSELKCVISIGLSSSYTRKSSCRRPDTKRPDAIGDRDVDVDQLDAALEAEAVLRLGARADRPIRRNQRDRCGNRGGENHT